MPNIEIHGNMWQAEAEALRSKVFAFFAGGNIASEMVVTIARDKTIDARGMIQPFLRVYDTDETRLDLITERLEKEFRMYVEPLLLRSRPKKTSQPQTP